MILRKELCQYMTSQEERCFLALCKWKRKELVWEWTNALSPKLHYYEQSKTLNSFAKALYWLLTFLLLPVIIFQFSTKLIGLTFRFPYRYLSTFFLPKNLVAPSERNIQGVHYSFGKYAELRPTFYIRCVDDWIKILYGVDHTFSEFIDRKMVNNIRQLGIGGVEQHAIHIFSQARENLTRQLGNYR